MAEKILAEDVVAKDGSDRDTSIESVADTPAKYIFKLDMRLIPILGCTYTILFLDRTNSTSSLHISHALQPAAC
jgi:hypothetical protein